MPQYHGYLCHTHCSSLEGENVQEEPNSDPDVTCRGNAMVEDLIRMIEQRRYSWQSFRRDREGIAIGLFSAEIVKDELFENLEGGLNGGDLNVPPLDWSRDKKEKS